MRRGKIRIEEDFRLRLSHIRHGRFVDDISLCYTGCLVDTIIYGCLAFIFKVKMKRGTYFLEIKMIDSSQLDFW